MSEELKVIANHSNYFISNKGAVYRKWGEELKQLHPYPCYGHARVDLDGEQSYVSKLVMDAFNPNPNPNLKIFHIDSDMFNNELENLVWVTPSELQRYSQYTVEYRRQLLGQW